MKSLTYALIGCVALTATAACSIRTRDVASTPPPATTVVVPSQPAPVVVTPAPAPGVVVTPAPSATVVTPAPAPGVVVSSPSASIVTPVPTTTWCGGAYSAAGGTSFGSCPQ